MSGMGVGMSILTKLMEKARRRGLSDEDFHSLATPEGDSIIDQLVGLMMETKEFGKVNIETHTVTVDYGLSVKKACKVGEYDDENDEITSENFPSTRTGKAGIEIKTVCFNLYMSLDETLARLDRMSLRPAELSELLALGAQKPDLQRKFTIVALGSVWEEEDGHCWAPLLGGHELSRELGLSWFGWDHHCRLAAVRK
ncbi:MAG TPA: hypothetical protein ENI70_00300 [Candidatus Peregrinibacteria bacterium]|nr:hypothetical protein [Candidatus Peregrinibacteria bacterium]